MSKHTNRPWYIERAYQRARQEQARGVTNMQTETLEQVDWQAMWEQERKRAERAEAEVARLRALLKRVRSICQGELDSDSTGPEAHGLAEQIASEIDAALAQTPGAEGETK